MAAAFFGFPQHFLELAAGHFADMYTSADFYLWEDANGLDFNPRVEPKANASCDAERPPSRQGVPVNRAA
jgi:hypothetical protein